MGDKSRIYRHGAPKFLGLEQMSKPERRRRERLFLLNFCVKGGWEVFVNRELSFICFEGGKVGSIPEEGTNFGT